MVFAQIFQAQKKRQFFLMVNDDIENRKSFFTALGVTHVRTERFPGAPARFWIVRFPSPSPDPELFLRAFADVVRW